MLYLKNIKKASAFLVLSLTINTYGNSTQTNNIEPIISSKKDVQKYDNWNNNKIPTQTSNTTVVFTVKPSADKIDGVIGFSKENANQYKDLGIIVRFAPNGYIDARDGKRYKKNFSSRQK